MTISAGREELIATMRSKKPCSARPVNHGHQTFNGAYQAHRRTMVISLHASRPSASPDRASNYIDNPPAKRLSSRPASGQYPVPVVALTPQPGGLSQITTDYSNGQIAEAFDQRTVMERFAAKMQALDLHAKIPGHNARSRRSGPKDFSMVANFTLFNPFAQSRSAGRSTGPKRKVAASIFQRCVLRTS